MIISHLKSTLRNLIKHKSFTAINVIGLSVGIASFILIMMYVGYELSFEKFYKNSDNIYRVYMKYQEGETFEPGDAQTYFQTGSFLQDKFPEIEEYVRLYQLGKAGLIVEENVIDDSRGFLADSNFFKVFDLELISGAASNVLQGTKSIVISELIEDKLFGKESGLNKVISCYRNGKKRDFEVTGIFEGTPENTSLKINFLLPFAAGKGWLNETWKPNWNSNNYFTFLLLNKHTNVEELSKKIESVNFQWEEERHAIEPFTDIHLYSDKPYEVEANGSAKRIYFLLIIAITIIILSWLNYINLSVTRVMEHAKETGIRKTIGANKNQLRVQFLIESIILNLLSIAIASIIVVVVMPFMTNLLGINFTLVYVLEKYVVYFAIIILGALLSGLYPAFLLSRLQPIKVLKGKYFSSYKNLLLRKVLVISQFTITIILLASSMLVSKQLNFIQNEPLGVDMNKVLCVTGDIYDSSNAVEKNLLVFKSKLQKLPFIEKVATAETYPGDGYTSLNYSIGLTLPNGHHNDNFPFYYYKVDDSYIPLLNIEMVAGSNFLNNTNNKNVILNETACEKFDLGNYQDLINTEINLGGEDYNIIGVVDDYSHFGLNKTQIPLFLFNSELAGLNLLIRFNENNKSLASLDQSINTIEQEWNRLFPASTFSYSFIDENFNKQYINEKQFKIAFNVFSFIALLIACLGLLGIVNYIVMQRTKEIGVRKVNGAKIGEVLITLNKDFVKWIIIAIIISIPIAQKIMNIWLSGFAVKTTVDWWIFVLAGALAIGIALLTISWQTFRAARRNPIEALRYE